LRVLSAVVEGRDQGEQRAARPVFGRLDGVFARVALRRGPARLHLGRLAGVEHDGVLAATDLRPDERAPGALRAELAEALRERDVAERSDGWNGFECSGHAPAPPERRVNLARDRLGAHPPARRRLRSSARPMIAAITAPPPALVFAPTRHPQ